MISLSSCFHANKTKLTSDYCILYEPLPNDLDKDIVNLWERKTEEIIIKNSNGEMKTLSEKLLEVLIDNIGTNYKKYLEKG